MIELHNIEFAYKKDQVLFSGLTLGICDNEIVAIVGTSGCGKTTLLNLIAGILNPLKGDIERLNDNIAYLMQSVTLLSYKTAWENIFLACELRGIKIDENIKKIAHQMLNTFNIDSNALSKFPKELSGGMRQRIGLIQTLLTDSSLILLDEPFNAIDINSLNRIKLYMWEYIVRSKKTMIFITHDIEQALQLSNRIIIMKSSKKILEIVPDAYYSVLSPDKRVNTDEYKKLFIKVLEELKYEE